MDLFQLRILHLDQDLVAIDKPAGLLVHPSALDAHEDRSALQLLRDQLGERLWPGVELPHDGAPLGVSAPCGPEWNALLHHAR